jgi:hypothetical protein
MTQLMTSPVVTAPLTTSAHSRAGIGAVSRVFAPTRGRNLRLKAGASASHARRGRPVGSDSGFGTLSRAGGRPHRPAGSVSPEPRSGRPGRWWLPTPTGHRHGMPLAKLDPAASLAGLHNGVEARVSPPLPRGRVEPLRSGERDALDNTTGPGDLAPRRAGARSVPVLGEEPGDRSPQLVDTGRGEPMPPCHLQLLELVAVRLQELRCASPPGRSAAGLTAARRPPGIHQGKATVVGSMSAQTYRTSVSSRPATFMAQILRSEARFRHEIENPTQIR